jgi:hypothetical protein
MKYQVTAEMTVTVTTLVSAPNVMAARLKAARRPVSSNWHDDGDSREEWVHDELDGEPTIVSCTPINTKPKKVTDAKER